MKSPSNFERLLLGCMDSYDSNQIVILQHFSRSTRDLLIYFLQCSNLKISAKNRPNFKRMKMKFHFSFVFFDEFCDFLAKFDEILPEFHRNGQEMTKCLEILRKSARKIRKMPEISGIGEKFHSSFHFFNPLL